MTKEKNATSGTEKEVVKNLRTSREQEDTGTTSGNPKEEEEPGKNKMTREKNATSGAEKEALNVPWTSQEQEDTGTTSGNLKEGRTRRQYPRTLATL
ncbi:hypothetical protein NDU88_007693 [Pleurodeles waltl]|uniref:Uncharacterized protein n=1 Tax=Pleurodeles waltl TaxID=8319 RepID=A0AAV7NYP2_PLEWA|nr:hypothetical protein NDU88_007693 [Pleurodeles waltl]